MSQGEMKFTPVIHGLFSAFSRAKIDGRSKLGRAVIRLRKDLVEHVGGESRVSVTQRLLIEQIISRVIRRRMYEGYILQGKEMRHEAFFIALENGLTRDLNYLGIYPREIERVPSLEEYLKEKSVASGSISSTLDPAPAVGNEDGAIKQDSLGAMVNESTINRRDFEPPLRPPGPEH
jgi:hypothetical protein